MLLPAYEDELFYSVLARTSDAFGLTSIRGLNRLVYGLFSVLPLIDFPAQLQLLSGRLLPGSPYGAKEIIRDHSLFNYHSAFSGQRSRSEALAAIEKGATNHAMLILYVVDARVDLHLRFCMECISNDLQAGRYPYWRRHHQLPGVVCCAAHARFLRKTSIVRRTIKDGYRSVQKVLDDGVSIDALDGERPNPLQMAVAASSARLSSYDRTHDPSDLRLKLRDLLQAAGWARGSRLDRSGLLTRVKDSFGPNVLEQLDVRYSNDQASNDADGGCLRWVNKALTRITSVRHPLPYLIVMAAVGLSADELLSSDFSPTASNTTEDLRFDGPCGNRRCRRYDPPVPRSRPEVHPPQLCTICCPACGFTYQHRSVVAGRSRRIVLEYGPVWDQDLREECLSGTMSGRELTQEFGEGVRTIKARALQLGVWHPRWGQKTRAFTSVMNEKREEAAANRSRVPTLEEHREIWLGVIRKYPEASRKQLISRARNSHRYLCTHDPSWIDEVSPRAAHTGMPKRDMPGMDRSLAALIRGASEAIRGLDAPVRVSQNSIARHLNRGRIVLNREVMPLTHAAMMECVETADQFIVRRRGRRRDAAPT